VGVGREYYFIFIYPPFTLRFSNLPFLSLSASSQPTGMGLIGSLILPIVDVEGIKRE